MYSSNLSSAIDIYLNCINLIENYYYFNQLKYKVIKYKVINRHIQVSKVLSLSIYYHYINYPTMTYNKNQVETKAEKKGIHHVILSIIP